MQQRLALALAIFYSLLPYKLLVAPLDATGACSALRCCCWCLQWHQSNARLPVLVAVVAAASHAEACISSMPPQVTSTAGCFELVAHCSFALTVHMDFAHTFGRLCQKWAVQWTSC